jgi:DNA-binding GntR family transcriptional regulator
MPTAKEPTLNRQVYREVLRQLLDGEIPLGAQLDERTLAAQIGVSRTPVREAIIQLVREGLVDYYPYRGHFVKMWTPKEVNDLFEVRKVLEALAVRLAVRKVSEEDLDELRTIVADIQDALRHGDIEGFSEADRLFHNTIVQKTGNQTLIDGLDRLACQIQVIRTIANRAPDLIERMLNEWPRILAALEARDAERSAELMLVHIEDARKTVVGHLQELEAAAEKV